MTEAAAGFSSGWRTKVWNRIERRLAPVFGDRVVNVVLVGRTLNAGGSSEDTEKPVADLLKRRLVSRPELFLERAEILREFGGNGEIEEFGWMAPPSVSVENATPTVPSTTRSSRPVP
ncbi:hypothetical protein [Streptomyces tailanensis]|uniref:hypothetical protein n=1 Tax=Streptomyces tailanensis TaxID=2569858 RepID=UPI00122E1471|nr:hypothetical protein [Streptomyces tailanensis]